MAKMEPSSYNAIASPMHLFKDCELLTREELRRRKEEALVKQEKKSPFVVGTMAQVNKRIGELDRSLQDYTQLVFDSRISDAEDTAVVMPFSPRSSLASAKHKRKEKEVAEIKAFSGVYSIHSAVGQAPERIKNVHKISMKLKKKERKKSADTSGAKPKFVELFTFPGYQSATLTALPHSTTTSEIFNKVIKAQNSKLKVHSYEEEFNRMIYSHMSQAMLQDIYWWVFLEKFSTQKTSQPKFFNRVSHNYIKFIFHIQSYQHKEAILNSYPEFMAQSIYVAFAETFPDSYKQFGDDFKEFLLQTAFEWMTGILPAPRKFLKWSADLEPAGKKREAAMGKAPPPKETKNAAAVSSDDWLATIDAVSSNNRTGVKNFGSEMSLASRATSTNKSRHGRGHGSESSRSEDTTNLIDSVADAQHKPRFPRPPAVVAVSSMLTPVQEVVPSRLSEFTQPEALDGIEEERSTVAFTRAGSKAREKTGLSKRRAKSRTEKKVIESHPACKGADMVTSLFDVRGSCPLVSHYMKAMRVDTDAGQKVNVSRSELKNLPPLDAPTYRDVIKETFRTIKSIEKGIHKSKPGHIKADMGQHSQFVIQQNKQAKYQRETQACLLSDTKEVKRLSNLLIIESSAEKEPGEKSNAKDTSKLDRLFDQALQKAADTQTKA